MSTERRIVLDHKARLTTTLLLGDDFEMEARRVRRKEAAENGASGGHLDGRRSSLAVLDFENPRDVADSDRRGVSEGGTEEREDERERNNGGKVRLHDGC